MRKISLSGVLKTINRNVWGGTCAMPPAVRKYFPVPPMTDSRERGRHAPFMYIFIKDRETVLWKTRKVFSKRQEDCPAGSVHDLKEWSPRSAELHAASSSGTPCVRHGWQERRQTDWKGSLPCFSCLCKQLVVRKIRLRM